MKYPEIFLAADNCFASKRWTKPEEWMRILAGAGIFCAEAGADTEFDPLYHSPAYLEEWLSRAEQAMRRTGVRIVNFYSGHGTYATLGLAHYDRRNCDRLQSDWLYAMIEAAARLNCGLGFFCHAFDQRTLQCPELWRQARADLFRRLAEIAGYAAERKVICGVEQMYSPHQIPWTVKQAENLLQEIWRTSRTDFYITIDTGHQSGQARFVRPEHEEFELVRQHRSGRLRNIWLGPDFIYDRIVAGASEADLNQDLDLYDYLFAAPEDGCTEYWLEKLGSFSPIIHLQQTDGSHSAHHPFTAHYNTRGRIRGGEVLRALKRAYDAAERPDMPRRCDKIYLTLELFGVTAAIPGDIVADLRESAAYWRRFVPEDGWPLDRLVEALPPS